MSDGTRRADLRGQRPAVAVLLPCYNEELTIGKTIKAFRAALPHAEIWVCDNNSKDNTYQVALDAGAIVVREQVQGKGAAVRRLFAEADADVFVMADGDLTYDASVAPKLVNLLIRDRLDMVIGGRMKDNHEHAFRAGHRFGNFFFSKVVSLLFRTKIADLFSGYRIMSRRFVKTFPAASKRFEIESELTTHLVDNGLPYAEVETKYGVRPEGSHSKLSSISDATRIIFAIANLFRYFRPLSFFGALAFLFFVVAVGLSTTIFHYYFTTGLIPNLPTAIFVVGLATVSFVFLVCGLVLDAVRSSRQAAFRSAYLSFPSPGARPAEASLRDEAPPLVEEAVGDVYQLRDYTDAV